MKLFSIGPLLSPLILLVCGLLSSCITKDPRYTRTPSATDEIVTENFINEIPPTTGDVERPSAPVTMPQRTLLENSLDKRFLSITMEYSLWGKNNRLFFHAFDHLFLFFYENTSDWKMNVFDLDLNKKTDQIIHTNDSNDVIVNVAHFSVGASSSFVVFNTCRFTSNMGFHLCYDAKIKLLKIEQNSAGEIVVGPVQTLITGIADKLWDLHITQKGNDLFIAYLVQDGESCCTYVERPKSFHILKYDISAQVLAKHEIYPHIAHYRLKDIYAHNNGLEISIAEYDRTETDGVVRAHDPEYHQYFFDFELNFERKAYLTTHVAGYINFAYLNVFIHGTGAWTLYDYMMNLSSYERLNGDYFYREQQYLYQNFTKSSGLAFSQTRYTGVINKLNDELYLSYTDSSYGGANSYYYKNGELKESFVPKLHCTPDSTIESNTLAVLYVKNHWYHILGCYSTVGAYLQKD